MCDFSCVCIAQSRSLSSRVDLGQKSFQLRPPVPNQSLNLCLWRSCKPVRGKPFRRGPSHGPPRMEEGEGLDLPVSAHLRRPGPSGLPAVSVPVANHLPIAESPSRASLPKTAGVCKTFTAPKLYTTWPQGGNGLDLSCPPAGSYPSSEGGGPFNEVPMHHAEAKQLAELSNRRRSTQSSRARCS